MCLWWIARESCLSVDVWDSLVSGSRVGLCGMETDVPLILCREDFPDSMTTMWDKNKVASLLSSAFAPNFAQQLADENAKVTSNIDVLITFDSYGVSSHPNHVSLYLGARSFVGALLRSKPGQPSPVTLYTLTTVGIVRKFSSLLDMFATLLRWIGVRHENEANPGGLIFMNQLIGDHAYGTARQAMTEAHKSQMVWFRHGWITFSRYMLINDLRREWIQVQP